MSFLFFLSKLLEKCNHNTSYGVKKMQKRLKDNYRPVSILSNISKIYDRLMSKKISEHFEPMLSKFRCGFRRGFSNQHCLITMLGKLRSAADNLVLFSLTLRNFGALLIDLSNSFDCLCHDLLPAKLNVYGFSLTALRL